MVALTVAFVATACGLTDRGSVDKVVDKIADAENCEEVEEFKARAQEESEPEKAQAINDAIDQRIKELDCPE